MIARRAFLAATAGTAASAGATSIGGCATGVAESAPRAAFDAGARIRALESGEARLGVCLLDTGNGQMAGNRMDEHFAFCSSFKLALAGAFLREADAGRLDLAEKLAVSPDDRAAWWPMRRSQVPEDQFTIANLAQAAQEHSDGLAANLLIRRLGGPPGVTAKFREMGDTVTRLDRYEPDLGMVLSADLRDTTTPQAMAALVARLTTGTLLSPQSRETLLTWMQNTRTGTKRLRAGLPPEWRSGNKTGTGRDAGITNKYNDVAITFPPGRAPILIAAYFDCGEYTEQLEDRHQAVLAEVGRIAAQWAML
jgi:beta-lactamase class A